MGKSEDGEKKFSLPGIHLRRLADGSQVRTYEQLVEVSLFSLSLSFYAYSFFLTFEHLVEVSLSLFFVYVFVRRKLIENTFCRDNVEVSLSLFFV